MNDEQLCRKVADILGESSGAHKAIVLLDSLRAEGRFPELVSVDKTWLVINFASSSSGEKE